MCTRYVIERIGRHGWRRLQRDIVADKIYEIAAKVGYQKTSYFIKVFKERYGITPQEFRDK